MRILIAGASGFIGQALVKYFHSQNHTLIVIGRNKAKLETLFANQIIALDWQELQNSKQINNIEVIINLAGENIATRLWTTKRKQELISSRVSTTQQLIKACQSFNSKPSCFICASGVGIYPLEANIYDENFSITQGEDNHTFLEKLAFEWENEAKNAEFMGIRVVNIRQGVVLSQTGGFLKKMILPYKLGLGGRIGNGQQPFPWIALPDVVRAVEFIINQPHLSGPINLVAPDLIDQARFSKILAASLHRPAYCAIPAWLLKLVLGEMANELFLNAVKVIPKRLLSTGFIFKYPNLKSFLESHL